MKHNQIIIGINAFHADSSACLIINGKLIAAIEEERINRKKHYAGYPVEAINECLKIGQIDISQVTDVAFNTKPYSNIIHKGIYLFKNLSFKKNSQINRLKQKKNLGNIFLQRFKLKKKINFHYIEHHLAHIASAFYPSGFDIANGLSIDGSGDFVSVAIAECKNKKIKLIEKVYFPESLGIFYHAMTQFLGFKNYGDEYKIMGLAAYGQPIYFKKILENLFIENKIKEIKLNLNYFNHHKINFKYIADENLLIDQIFSDKLIQLFDNEKREDNFRENFASSVQEVYEFFFNKIIISIAKKNFSKNLVFSGGCALNSSANRLITNFKDKFNKVFINYAPGDNGGALGAAFVIAAKSNFEIQNSEDPYMGTRYNDIDVKNILESKYFKNKIIYKHVINENELLDTTTKYISEGNVIGWFQDKMEFGPRALGNRSILADPRNHKMKDIINSKIKKRETFRPFAPSVLKEFQSEWFETDFKSPYMSTVIKVKKEKRNLIPAVTHFDNTSRLQTVDKNINSKFSNLIFNFFKKTNVPILLNTSFNENEPIVLKPQEALECLLRTEMDALIINNFIIKKKN